MKKILFLALVLSLASCRKDPIPDPPKKFMVEVVNDNPQAGNLIPSGKIEVVEGSNFNITINSNFGWDVDSIIVNDNRIKMTSSSYSVLINSNTKIRGIFRKNQYGLLCGKAWKNIKNETREPGTIEWFHQNWNPIGYLFTGTSMAQSFDSNNVLIGQGGYLLKGDSLIIGERRRKILTLSEDTLKLQGIITGAFTVETKATYVHP